MLERYLDKHANKDENNVNEDDDNSDDVNVAYLLHHKSAIGIRIAMITVQWQS